jgi:Superfamily II DNA/RNA helicases, SNF2 family
VSLFPDFFFLSWMLWQCLSGYRLPKEILVKSGKFQKLDEMLPKLKCEGHRVLIFSQFVIMLDVLQEYLHIRGHRYLRLDGSTPVTLRCVWERLHLQLYMCNININVLILGHLITCLSAQRWWWIMQINHWQQLEYSCRKWISWE